MQKNVLIQVCTDKNNYSIWLTCHMFPTKKMAVPSIVLKSYIVGPVLRVRSQLTSSEDERRRAGPTTYDFSAPDAAASITACVNALFLMQALHSYRLVWESKTHLKQIRRSNAPPSMMISEASQADAFDTSPKPIGRGPNGHQCFADFTLTLL